MTMTSRRHSSWVFRWSRVAAPALLWLAAGAGNLAAKTSNGNDFALYFSEAKNADERKLLLADALDRPHIFRYLQIMEMEETDAGMRITAFEPASLMDVKFTVDKPVSLALLRKDPVSKVGRAIAVTGKLVSADDKEKLIVLEGTIVRHKDRLSPAVGKELLYEVDPRAVFYSYTGGSRPVSLTYEDRDLLKRKAEIIAKGGPDGWVKFLEDELARRKQQRGAQEKQNKAGDHKGTGKAQDGGAAKTGSGG